tara:strand:+ start:165 stop:494 length:330 start_codon:yes stop_codon:yes gene_type:complete
MVDLTRVKLKISLTNRCFCHCKASQAVAVVALQSAANGANFASFLQAQYSFLELLWFRLQRVCVQNGAAAWKVDYVLDLFDHFDVFQDGSSILDVLLAHWRLKKRSERW